MAAKSSTNKVVVTLEFKDDGKAQVAFKNIEQGAKNAIRSLNNLEATSGKLSTKMTSVSGALKEAQDAIDRIGRLGETTGNRLKDFNAKMQGLLITANKMQDAMRSATATMSGVGAATLTAGETAKKGLDKAAVAADQAGKKVSLLSRIFGAFRGSTDTAKKGLDDLNKAKDKGIEKVGFLVTKVLKLMVAYQLLRVAMRTIEQEIRATLTVTEEYQQSVTSMAALMTTFAKIKPGQEVVDVYKQAELYAQKLVVAMEKIDIQTVANAKDLTTMVQSFIMGGIQIDITNQKVVTGFRDFANALKILVGNFPNQTAQMAQEIRAMISGQARATDMLGRVMKAKLGPAWKEIMAEWRRAGPDQYIIKLGETLKGFGEASKSIEGMWETVKSSFETLHNVVFRQAFGDVQATLVNMMKDFIAVFRDAEGNLTEFGKTTVEVFNRIWTEIKIGAQQLAQFVSYLIYPLKIIIPYMWQIRDILKSIMVMLTTALIAQSLLKMAVALGVFVKGLFVAKAAATGFAAALRATPLGWFSIMLGVVAGAFTMFTNNAKEAARSVDEVRSSLKHLTADELERKRTLLETAGKMMGKVTYEPTFKVEELPTTPKARTTEIEKINAQLKLQSDMVAKNIQVLTDGTRRMTAAEVENLEKKKTAIKIMGDLEKLQVDITTLEGKRAAALEASRKASVDSVAAKRAAQQYNAADYEIDKKKLDIANKQKTLYELAKGEPTVKRTETGFSVSDAKEVAEKAGIVTHAFESDVALTADIEKHLKAVNVQLVEARKSISEGLPPELLEPPKEVDEKYLNAWKRYIELRKRMYKELQEEETLKGQQATDDVKTQLERREINEAQASKAIIDTATKTAAAKNELYEEELTVMDKLYSVLYYYTEQAKKTPQDLTNVALELFDVTTDLQNKQREVERAGVKTITAEETAELVRQMEREIALEELRGKMTIAEAQAAQQLNTIRQEGAKAELEYLRERGKIGGEEYYQTMLRMEEEAAAQELNLIKAREQAYDAEWTARISKEAAGGDKALALAREKVLQHKEFENEKTAATARGENARQEIIRQSAEDIQAIWDRAGAVGVQEKALRDLAVEWKKVWDDLYNFTKNIFTGIQQESSNVLFDAMKSQLKSFKDYYMSIWDTILRYYTDMIGKMVAQWIAGMTAMKGAENGLGGGLLSLLGLGGLGNEGESPQLEATNENTKALDTMNVSLTGNTDELRVSMSTLGSQIMVLNNTIAAGGLGGGIGGGAGASVTDIFTELGDMGNAWDLFSSDVTNLTSELEDMGTAWDMFSTDMSGVTRELESIGEAWDAFAAATPSATELAGQGGFSLGGTIPGYGLAAMGGSALGKIIAPKSKYGGLGGAIGGIAGYGLATSSLATSGAFASTAISAGLVGPILGSVVPVLGTAIGAVVGTLLAKYLGGDKKTPTFQAKYMGEGLWDFIGKSGLKLSDSQKRQLSEAFETFRFNLKKYAVLTGKSTDILEVAQTKLGKYAVESGSDMKSAVAKSMKEYTKLTGGFSYFKSLQNSGEKFEETVARVVAALEKLRDTISSIRTTIAKLESLDTIMEGLMEPIEAARTAAERAKDIIDTYGETGMKDILERATGGNLYTSATMLKKGFSKLGAKADLTDEDTFIKWAKKIKDADIIGLFDTLTSGVDSGLGNFSDIVLNWESRIKDELESASPKVREAFTNFFQRIRDLSEQFSGAALNKKVKAEVADFVSELKKLTTVMDPAKVQELANTYVQAINDHINAVLQLREILKQLKEQMKALRLESAKFFADVTLKIMDLTEDVGTAASDALREYGVNNIAIPLAMDQENRDAGGVGLLTTDERLALAKAGIDIVDQWLAARTKEIEQKYNNQIKANDNAIKLLNKQLDVIKKWNDLLHSVQDSIKELTLSSDNPEDVAARLELAKQAALSAQAQYVRTGSAEDAEKYRAALMDYVKLAQEAGDIMAEYQRPGEEYQKIYDWVLAELKRLEQTATAMGGSDEEIRAIEEKIAYYEEQNNILQASMEAELKAINQEAAGYYQWFRDIGMAAYTEKMTEVNTQIGEVETALNDILGGVDFETWKETQLQLLWDIKNAAEGYLGSLPGGATGAFVSKPSIMKVAEIEPEYLVPKSKVGQFVNEMSSSSNSVTIAPTINVTAQGSAIDENVLARAISYEIERSFKYGKGRELVKRTR